MFCGIALMGMRRWEFGDSSLQTMARRRGLKVSSLHWAGGFTGHDGRTFREAMHDGLDAIELASALKANSLVVLAGSRSGHTRNHAKRLLTGALKELAEAASAVGVQLAVEPMHIGCAQDFTFLTSIPDTLDVIAKIGQPNLGIVFDSYHLGQDENVIDWLPSIVPLIRLVQLGDARGAPLGEQNRCMLGEGHLPLSSIVQVIESYEYSGFYEVELVGEDMESYDYDRLLADSRKKMVEFSAHS